MLSSLFTLSDTQRSVVDTIIIIIKKGVKEQRNGDKKWIRNESVWRVGGRDGNVDDDGEGRNSVAFVIKLVFLFLSSQHHFQVLGVNQNNGQWPRNLHFILTWRSLGIDDIKIIIKNARKTPRCVVDIHT